MFHRTDNLQYGDVFHGILSSWPDVKTLPCHVHDWIGIMACIVQRTSYRCEKPADNLRKLRITDLPTSRSLFNICNVISVLLNMIHVTIFSLSCQDNGCWWPGAHLAPGHLHPPWWRMPISAYQDGPNVKWPGIEYNTVTSQWARWRPKSLASRLFAQPFIQAQIKENSKVPRRWPLWGDSTDDPWIPITKRKQRGCLHLMTSPCHSSVSESRCKLLPHSFSVRQKYGSFREFKF